MSKIVLTPKLTRELEDELEHVRSAASDNIDRALKVVERVATETNGMTASYFIARIGAEWIRFGILLLACGVRQDGIRELVHRVIDETEPEVDEMNDAVAKRVTSETLN